MANEGEMTAPPTNKRRRATQHVLQRLEPAWNRVAGAFKVTLRATVQGCRIGARSVGRVLWAAGFWTVAVLVRPVNHGTLQRWFELAVLHTCAAALALVLLPPLTDAAKAGLDRTGPTPVWLAVLVLAVALAIPYVGMIRLGGLHARHFARYAIVYPPTWFAVIPIPIEGIFLRRWYGITLFGGADDEVLLWAVALWALSPLIAICLFGARRAFEPSRVPAPADEAALGAGTLETLASHPEHRLITWLEREQPVESVSDDMFGARHVARRIAGRFYDKRIPTIGLVGPWGSGKSSTLRLVEHYVRKDREFATEMRAKWREGREGWQLARNFFPPSILTCSVSAWGLLDADGATVVLRDAVRCLSKHVDCLGLQSLPGEYEKALTGLGPTWVQVPLALSREHNPTEALRQLDPILAAINARLVIFIEDLDRNLGEPDMAISQDVRTKGTGARARVNTRVVVPPKASVFRSVQSMLDRLRDLDNVSFVLAISRTD